MDKIRSLSKKSLALILVAVLLVFGVITTMLVFDQMLPDIREQMSWERGTGDIAATSGDWQEYSESWTANLSENGIVAIDLEAVYVDIMPYDGDRAQFHFTGQVRPTRNRDLPELEATTDRNRFSLKEKRQKTTIFGGGTSTDIRGTLKVELPKDVCYITNRITGIIR